MKKQIFIVSAFFLCTVLSLWGLGKSENNANLEPSDYKIILLLPGPINDQSWNATNYDGLLACNRDLGTNIEYLENIQQENFESAFKKYADRGYDLILAAGTQFDEAANEVAQYYPNTKFCVVNGTLSKSANVSPIFPKEYEASFLAGVIASYITESGIIATVGGFRNRAMVDLLDVYEKTTVNYAKVERDIEITIYRDYANSWEDVSLGKTMAEEMISKGADVLFFYANQVGLGAIQAARENNVKFIGFSSDQNSIAPGTVVASIGFDFAVFYKWALMLFLEGKLEGKVNLAGLEEGIFVPYYSDVISSEVRNAVEEARSNVINGSVDFVSMLSRSF
jgi:basic membrane protein A and related proteins